MNTVCSQEDDMQQSQVLRQEIRAAKQVYDTLLQCMLRCSRYQLVFMCHLLIVLAGGVVRSLTLLLLVLLGMMQAAVALPATATLCLMCTEQWCY
jgi:hypothetical protein